MRISAKKIVQSEHLENIYFERIRYMYCILLRADSLLYSKKLFGDFSRWDFFVTLNIIKRYRKFIFTIFSTDFHKNNKWILFPKKKKMVQMEKNITTRGPVGLLYRLDNSFSFFPSIELYIRVKSLSADYLKRII